MRNKINKEVAMKILKRSGIVLMVAVAVFVGQTTFWIN